MTRAMNQIFYLRFNQLYFFLRRKRAWFEHVTSHDSLSKTILQGTLEGRRRRGRQRNMLDGQHQRVDIPAQVGSAHEGLLQKGLEDDPC